MQCLPDMGRCPSAGSSMELRRFTLKQRQTFITRVNELQGQATTLEVSTVVVLHSRIDEARQAAWPARQAAWPGRRGCTPRPSQPSQLRRRLTTRLVGSRTALRKTGIPSGILNPVTDRTRTGAPSRNPKKPGNARVFAPPSAIESLRTVHLEIELEIDYTNEPHKPPRSGHGGRVGEAAQGTRALAGGGEPR